MSIAGLRSLSNQTATGVCVVASISWKANQYARQCGML